MLDDDLFANLNLHNDLSFVKEAPKIQKISGGEFEKFVKSILSELIKDNIPPTPTNYNVYFQKMLDGRPLTFKKKINEIIEFEQNDDDTRRANIEQEIKKSFSSISTLVHYIAMIYKHLETMKSMLKKRNSELAVSTGNLSVSNVIHALEADILRFSNILERYSDEIRENFDEVRQIYKQIEEQSDFDSKFGVYNKRYFLENLEKSIESNLKYGYHTTLLFFKVKDETLDQAYAQKDKIAFLKGICKIFAKNIPSGYTVAHYGNNVFATIMPHTNLDKAQEICDKFLESLENSNFFLADKEIQVDAQLAIGVVNKDSKSEELVDKCINALEDTRKDLTPFAIVER
ncbi:diguanylate cyclase [Campylobacter insulaenigrae]|uniref:GGDEF domain-containing protein n=1 Tax=Campylobacter insulaenigrae TaxID=260714 RepID=UPI000F6C749D|nr:diguanylate cyclase [Campylobacter insulaenigrae]MCR6591522.1 diguanylate cyclase [Campylobacter insulaenigrae]MCR6593057.1 diguanylate cyclase [Campylobacter insulaenigrae]VEJ52267.1 diguanylate cyclase [Campylobacter insulaenigrae]